MVTRDGSSTPDCVAGAELTREAAVPSGADVSVSADLTNSSEGERLRPLHCLPREKEMQEDAALQSWGPSVSQQPRLATTRS